MRTYDVRCPICGHRNNCYLEETEGWLECSSCGISIYIDPPYSDIEYSDEALPSVRKLIKKQHPSLEGKFVHIREISFGIEDDPRATLQRKAVS